MPYPQQNWRDEKRWNEPLLKAIRTVWVADEVFSTPTEEWERPQNDFYKWMIKWMDDARLTI